MNLFTKYIFLSLISFQFLTFQEELDSADNFLDMDNLLDLVREPENKENMDPTCDGLDLDKTPDSAPPAKRKSATKSNSAKRSRVSPHPSSPPPHIANDEVDSDSKEREDGDESDEEDDEPPKPKDLSESEKKANRKKNRGKMPPRNPHKLDFRDEDGALLDTSSIEYLQRFASHQKVTAETAHHYEQEWNRFLAWLYQNLPNGGDIAGNILSSKVPAVIPISEIHIIAGVM